MMALKQLLILVATVGALSGDPYEDNQRPELTERENLTSGMAIGLGLMTITHGCGKYDDGPELSVLVQRVDEKTPQIVQHSRETVERVLSAEEREAFDEFLATPQGEAFGKKLPELLGALGFVGLTNLCEP